MKQLLFLKPRIHQHCKSFLRDLLREGNLIYLRTPRLMRQFEHDSLPLNANATHNEHHEISENTRSLPPYSINDPQDDNETITKGQSRRPIRSNEDKKYEIYLCNYRYEGEIHSIEICATSFDDANAKRRALQHGEIIGVLQMSIPVNESWYYAILRFWKKLFGKV